MLARSRSIPPRLLALGALVAATACSTTDLPTVAPWSGEPAAARVRSLRITALSLARDTLAIDGPSTTYTATVEYTGNGKAAMGVFVQAYVLQGNVEAAAGGTSVNCGLAAGVVAEGVPCTFTFTTSASNATAAGGTLRPDTAKWELRLYQSGATGNTLYDRRRLTITLVKNAPAIASVSFQATTLFFGSPMPYVITFQNPTGVTQSDLLFQATFVQGSASGAGGGSYLNCGGGVGVLPPGGCSMLFSTTANTSTGLVEGTASWVVELLQGNTSLDTKTVGVYLSYPIT